MVAQFNRTSQFSGIRARDLVSNMQITRPPGGALGGRKVLPLIALIALMLGCADAIAAPDEIQVYTDDLNKPGERGLELHVNYAQAARRVAEYPGEQAPARVLRVTPEISIGLAPRWDAGLYLPTSLDTRAFDSYFDGPKLRLRWLNEHDHVDRTVFYGANLELARTSTRVNPAPWRTELRLIAGMRTGDWLLAVNPIVSKPWGRSADGNTGVDFDLAIKVNRRVDQRWALGIEHYGELGPINRLNFGADSGQASFVTVDLDQGAWELNFGVGYGWTAPVDKLVFKMIVGIPF